MLFYFSFTPSVTRPFYTLPLHDALPISAEAASRGIEVTAITRSGTEVPGAASSLAGDIADAEFDARIADAHDVIVSTTGPSRTGGDHRICIDGLSTLAEASGTTRLFVVGGAGLLVVGDTLLKDTDRKSTRLNSS